MRAAFTLVAGLSLSLVGCSSTAVSPALLAKPGVKTVIGGNGYPVFSSITVVRNNPSDSEKADLCMRRGIDGIEAVPVRDGAEVQASGTGSFNPPPPSISKGFRYTLTVKTGRSTTYVFDRIRYLLAGPIGAFEDNGAEDAYSEIEAVADRVNECVTSQQH